MSVEIVYYNTQPNLWLEQRLAVFGDVHTAVGADRRQFLTALSYAVGVSNITVTAGSVSALSTVLSKGLGLPLEPIDWAILGISGDDGVMLPHGALPLIVDGCVYGMIIESAAQCIIAVDDEPSAMQHLVDNYVAPYIQAVTAAAKPDVQSVDEPQPDNDEPIEPAAETVADEQPTESVEPELPALTYDSVDDNVQPTDLEPIDEIDLFADIDSDGFLDIEPKKKRHGVLIAFICVLSALVIAAAGGYVGYTKWWLPKQSDDSLKAARKAYSTQLQDASSVAMPSDYSLKFAALYAANNDVIGWLKVGGLQIDTPIVTAVMHSDDYYDTHLFNGKNNHYGTPYIKYGYDTAVNINPNLVVYGANTADGRGFSRLEELLTADGLKKVKSLTTDSVLYGQEKWQIISVMLLDADGKDYNYADNFRQLDDKGRAAAVKNAVERSKVATGFSASDFETVDYTDTFLTLVTPYSEDESKVIVVMASREKLDDTDDTADQPTTEGEGDTSSDPSSQTESEVASEPSEQ